MLAVSSSNHRQRSGRNLVDGHALPGFGLLLTTWQTPTLGFRKQERQLRTRSTGGCIRSIAQCTRGGACSYWIGDLLRLSSSRSEQYIGRRVVSVWHDHWQYLSHHSSQHPKCPNLLSVCLAMSSLVIGPSSCHLLVSILRLDWLVWLLGVQQIVFFWLPLCRVVPFVLLLN